MREYEFVMDEGGEVGIVPKPPRDPRTMPRIDVSPLRYLNDLITHHLDWELQQHYDHVVRLAEGANEEQDWFLKQAACTNYVTGLVKLYDMYMERDRHKDAFAIKDLLQSYGVEIFADNEPTPTTWALRRRDIDGRTYFG